MLEALGDSDPDRRRDAAELLVRAYRAPVLDLLRRKWQLEPADAEDLTQEFFARALEKNWLTGFDPARGRFRSFLRVCAVRFAANQYQARGRQKRGGNQNEVPLSDATAIAEAGDADSDARFRAEWVRSVLALALDALRAEAREQGRAVHLALFEAYDISDPPDDRRPSYQSLAAAHGLSETQVINHLAWARRRMRAQVLDVLRKLSGSEAEYREDVQQLLGIEAPP